MNKNQIDFKMNIPRYIDNDLLTENTLFGLLFEVQ